MKKLQLEIPILLPEIPDEKDRCVERMISILKEKDGIEKASGELPTINLEPYASKKIAIALPPLDDAKSDYHLN